MSPATSTALSSNDERAMPILRWTRSDDGNITIRILLGNVEQERFSLPGWEPEGGQGPPLASWLMDFYELSEQERRDKHQGSFEKYVLARREAGEDQEDPELASLLATWGS